MSIPAIIYLCLLGFSLLIAAHEHGKPKTGTNNFWVSATAIAIILTLLIYGGFFK